LLFVPLQGELAVRRSSHCKQLTLWSEAEAVHSLHFD
jgi:hypothetical protein